VLSSLALLPLLLLAAPRVAMQAWLLQALLEAAPLLARPGTDLPAAGHKDTPGHITSVPLWARPLLPSMAVSPMASSHSTAKKRQGKPAEALGLGSGRHACSY
jgi:hypothetical protein